MLTPTMYVSSRNSPRTWVTSLIKRMAGIYSCLPLLPPSTLILSFSTMESLEVPDFNQNAFIDLIVSVP
jgi:hypothetical protein